MLQNERIEYLEGRLAELEPAIDTLLFMYENEGSTLYQDQLTKMQISNFLFEAAAIRRKLAEIK